LFPGPPAVLGPARTRQAQHRCVRTAVLRPAAL